MTKVVLAALYADDYTDYEECQGVGIVTDANNLSRDMKILHAFAEGQYYVDIMSISKAMEFPNLLIASEFSQEFEEALMWEKYSIEAYNDSLFLKKNWNTLYDEHDNLSEEDEKNFMEHCAMLKAQELYDELPGDDVMKRLISKALYRLTK